MCYALFYCAYFAVPACSTVNLLMSNDRRIQEEKRNLRSLCFVLVIVWASDFRAQFGTSGASS